MNIEHFVNGKSTGTITPDTKAWRDHSINFQARSDAHYQPSRPSKVTFVEVPRNA